MVTISWEGNPTDELMMMLHSASIEYGDQNGLTSGDGQSGV